MSDAFTEPSPYVCDSAALHAIATCTNNYLRSQVRSLLLSGRLKVPTLVWNEFEAVHDGAAASIKDWVKEKIPTNDTIDAATAYLVEVSGIGYSARPYGNADLTAAGAAFAESAILLTSGPRQHAFYGAIPFLTVQDIFTLEELIEHLPTLSASSH